MPTITDTKPNTNPPADQQERVATKWCELCYKQQPIEQFPIVPMCSEGRLPICDKHRTSTQVKDNERAALVQLQAAGIPVFPPMPIVRAKVLPYCTRIAMRRAAHSPSTKPTKNWL